VDPHSFDGLVRRFSRALSRRSLVGGTIGAAVLAAAGGRESGLARKGKRGPKTEKKIKQDDCLPQGKKCCQRYHVENDNGKKKCACRPDGFECSSGSQCCGGSCQGNVCQSTSSSICRGIDSPCTDSAQCCSGTCQNNLCRTFPCRGIGAGCFLNGDCCSNACGDGVCRESRCNNTGGACASNGACCTNICGDGICRAAACTDLGGVCASSGQCCSNACGDGVCQPGACGTVGQTCSIGSNCCSGNCGLGEFFFSTCRTNPCVPAIVDPDVEPGFPCTNDLECCEGICEDPDGRGKICLTCGCP
jgi:hypothetical protein